MPSSHETKLFIIYLGLPLTRHTSVILFSLRAVSMWIAFSDVNNQSSLKASFFQDIFMTFLSSHFHGSFYLFMVFPSAWLFFFFFISPCCFHIHDTFYFSMMLNLLDSFYLSIMFPSLWLYSWYSYLHNPFYLFMVFPSSWLFLSLHGVSIFMTLFISSWCFHFHDPFYLFMMFKSAWLFTCPWCSHLHFSLSIHGVLIFVALYLSTVFSSSFFFQLSLVPLLFIYKTMPLHRPHNFSIIYGLPLIHFHTLRVTQHSS